MAEFTSDKMLPQSLEAEQAVLAAMFNDRDAILEAIPLLKESDFYRHDHGVLFATMRKMNEQNVPVDLVTITAQLDKDGNLEKLAESPMWPKLPIPSATPPMLPITPISSRKKPYCAI